MEFSSLFLIYESRISMRFYHYFLGWNMSFFGKEVRGAIMEMPQGASEFP